MSPATMATTSSTTISRTTEPALSDAGHNAAFLGGPAEVFDKVGREQLGVLLDFGLTPESYVLDIGCGCLRAGRWIMPVLKPGHYFGIEPAKAMLERGLRDFVDPEMLNLKHPHFDHNDRFDFSVFADDGGKPIRFTHAVARSVWTHADKDQITQMIRSFRDNSTPDGVFIASFNPAKWRKRNDYKGKGWVGRSHESSVGGMVNHSFRWISRTCAECGMKVMRVTHRPIVNGQPWLVVTHAH